MKIPLILIIEFYWAFLLYTKMKFISIYLDYFLKKLRIILKKAGVFMIEQDTIKLLRECDAGIKMGVKSICDVIDHVRSDELHSLLHACKDRHDELDKELQEMLGDYDDVGKEPSLMAEAMSKIKTEMKLQMKNSDRTVADLMTDGCNMGVKSLSKYLNQYAAADEKSKDIAKRLITLEATLAEDMRGFL